MIRNKLLLFSILLNSFICVCQNTKLKNEIENFKKDTSLKHAVWSVCVMNTKNDSTIAAYNSEQSLVPASTLKIITTAAALSILGNDFMFQTKLQFDGTLDSASGILKGNLFILGGGDPALESENFKDKNDSLTAIQKWALILKAKGIKKIEGAVIGDAGIFEDNMTPSQWIWGDMGNYFGSGASGLTYHDNKYTVYFKTGKPGTQSSINKTVPQIENLQLINNVRAAANNTDNAVIYGSQYSNYRIAEGTLPAGKSNYEVDGAVPDPALFCAHALEQALKNIDISISKKSTTVRALKEANEYTGAERKTLYTNYSPALDKIIYYTNLKSINLYAEHLLKYICYFKTGLGTEEAGTDIIKSFWKNKGVDVSGFFMADGCGLSRANVITTKTEVQVLNIMARDKNFKAFYNSFPAAGKSGSLGGLCSGTFAENNLRAKSGYITHARGYAGYVKNRKGDLLSFSVLVNNYECTPSEMKKKLEKILIAIAEGN